MKKLYAIVLLFLLIFIVSCGDKTYKMHFDTMGGASIESVEFEEVADINLPEDPTKDGFVFGGWFIDDEYGESFDIEMMEEENLVLFAKWDEILSDLTIQLQAIYELAISSDMFDGTYEEWLETVRGPQGLPGEDGIPGENGQSPIFTVTEGVLMWTFDLDTEWTVLFDFNAVQGEDGLSAYQLFLQENPAYSGTLQDWISEYFSTPEEVVYTVSFDSQEGTSVVSQEVEAGAKAMNPEDPTKAGYLFDGWYIEGTEIEWVFLGYVVTEDTNLEAKWILNELTYLGVYNTTVTLNKLVDVSFNVSVHDQNGVDMTDDLHISSEDCTIGNVDMILDTNSATTCHVVYSVTTEGFTTEKTSEIIVTGADVLLEEYNVIKSWNFDNYEGIEDWEVSELGGSELYVGNCYDDYTTCMSVEAYTGDSPWMPQLSYTGIEFKEGYYYNIYMKMKSDVNKTIHVTAGEFLDEFPFFVPVKTDYTDMFDIGTSWQAYNYTFYVSETIENGSIVLDFGAMPGQLGVDALMYMDDIIVTESSSIKTENVYSIAELHSMTSTVDVSVIGTVGNILNDEYFTVEDDTGLSLIVKCPYDDMLFLKTQRLYRSALVYVKGFLSKTSDVIQLKDVSEIYVIERDTRRPVKDSTMYLIQDIRDNDGYFAFGKQYRLNTVVFVAVFDNRVYTIKDYTNTGTTYYVRLRDPDGTTPFSVGYIFTGMNVVFYDSAGIGDSRLIWYAYRVT